MGGSGAVAFSANNPGTLILNGNNTYPGDTTVASGTIGGSGTLAGNLVMVGGTTSPGLSIGTFTVNGSATLAGTTLMELNRSLSPNSDRLVVGGTLSFGGVLQVVLGPGAPAPQAGDVYQLFNKGSSTTFTSVSLPSLASGMNWDTTKLAVNGTISVSGLPTIGSVYMDGGNFVFSGTGGVEGQPYHVVMATDAATPLASWVPVFSDSFGPGGSFYFTINIVGGEPKAFFRVRAP
jgi:autotransporter-associated beta strand protein